MGLGFCGSEPKSTLPISLLLLHVYHFLLQLLLLFLYCFLLPNFHGLHITPNFYVVPLIWDPLAYRKWTLHIFIIYRLFYHQGSEPWRIVVHYLTLKRELLSSSSFALVVLLDRALGHLEYPPHLRTKVPYGLDTELSLDGAHSL